MDAYLALADRASAVRQARAATAAVLRRWQCTQGCIDDAVLIVSEMVTNAIQHGRGRIRLRLRRMANLLRLEVRDSSPELPSVLPANPDAESGRGLRIVSELSSRWGTTRVIRGKVVWAELPYRRLAARPPSGGRHRLSSGPLTAVAL
jgi:anti-sigma regulatory factor (Ser/Thr protein kinase)